MSEIKLPNGWVDTAFENVLDKIVGGGTPSKLNLSFFKGQIPFMTVKDMTTRFPTDTVDHISDEAVASSATTMVPKDSLIVATRMSLGKIVRPKFDTAINQDLKALFLTDGMHKTYIEYFWRSKANHIQDLGTGTTVKGIRLEDIRSLTIPLAPVPEQKRIADKLDTVLARADACRERLNRVPLILKRFKQSVLAAATSGKLTEDWRLTTKVKLGKLAPLGTMGEILAGQSPSVSQVNREGRGVPYVTGPEQWDGTKIIAHKWTEFPKRIAPENSIFVTVKGAGVGKTFPGCYAAIGRDVYAFVANGAHESKFVLFAIQSSAEEVVMKAKGLIPGLTKADIADHEVYIPTLQEQREIVRRVETIFAFADHLEARFTTVRDATERLTPALLAKAFRGELVPQDPSDEPASELLARIKNQREVGKFESKSKVTKKLKKAMKSEKIIPILEALKLTKKRLSASELFHQSGYPQDASVQLVEQFFLDIKLQLAKKNIVKDRPVGSNEDFFTLADNGSLE